MARVPFFGSHDEQQSRKYGQFRTERFIESKDKNHSNRDNVQKAWEYIGKEMECESNY
jgi:hypothetical protein